MGVGNFIHSPQEFSAPHSHSVFLPDYVVNPHPRFAALTRNIRLRRGTKVDIHMPLFPDVNTPEFKDENNDKEIHMDAMGFGMGMCCLVSF